MPLRGGCFCSALRYEIGAPLLSAQSCHCSKCRKVFSGAGSAFGFLAEGSFAWVGVTTALHRYASGDGWAIGSQFGADHMAVFKLKEPLTREQATRLTIALDHRYPDNKHVLGRFRVSVTDAENPLEFGVPRCPTDTTRNIGRWA